MDGNQLKLNKKEIRLVQELINLQYPTKDIEIQADLIRDIFKFDIQADQLKRIAPFKQILFSRVVGGVKTSANGRIQVQIKRVKKKNRS
jgi:hypothetical protein